MTFSPSLIIQYNNNKKKQNKHIASSAFITWLSEMLFSVPVGDLSPKHTSQQSFRQTRDTWLQDFSKGSNKSESKILGMATVCVCLCVCVCMCITLLSGMKLTPLYKANFSVEFRQAVFQRLISYCNGHQSTMSERTSNKEKRKTGDCWDSGITYWTRRPRGMSLPHTAYPILAYISNGTVNTIINLQPITPMEHKRQVGRDLAVILRCVSLLCQHTVTQYLTEKLLMQKSFWN